MQHAPKQRPEDEQDMTVAETYDLPPVTRQKSFFERKIVRRALPWFVIMSMFVFWELFVRVFGIQEFVLPAPSVVFKSMWQWREPIALNGGLLPALHRTLSERGMASPNA